MKEGRKEGRKESDGHECVLFMSRFLLLKLHTSLSPVVTEKRSAEDAADVVEPIDGLADVDAADADKRRLMRYGRGAIMRYGRGGLMRYGKRGGLMR